MVWGDLTIAHLTPTSDILRRHAVHVASSSGQRGHISTESHSPPRTQMQWAILVLHSFQRFCADNLVASECQPGRIPEQSSLVQRNHSSTKVMLVSDAVTRTDSRSQLFSEAFLASLGKHMVLAFSGAVPEQANFPFEILIPVGLMLVILGYFLVTQKDPKDPKDPMDDAFLKPSSDARPATSSMFTPSQPKARQGRPHEFAAAKTQGPQPMLISICPNLVVPDKVRS
eukprot:Skav211827  [mRNA]  locus=scaffold305:624770:625987:- [translate_table: standard]